MNFQLDSRQTQILLYNSKIDIGSVAEWFKAAVLKTAEPKMVPGVRIPALPPGGRLAESG